MNADKGQIRKNRLYASICIYLRASVAALLFSVTLEKVRVGVDAPVAQERPDAPHCLGAVKIDVGHEDGRGLGAGFGQDLALRAGDEARSPELDAVARRRWIRFMAGPVAREPRQAVGDGVRALNGDPGIALTGLLGIAVAWIPANGRRVEQQIGTVEGHEARGLGVPLVPAHQHAEPPDAGVDGLETEIAGREVEFLVA